jgi:diguanylate cyclase (GGDEF)-like protein/PAS domain S-box-containing protein
VRSGVGLMPLIFIVDDLSTNRRIYSRLAQSIGAHCKVMSFADPAQALAEAGKNTPDLVIADFKMPLMDGAELTRALRLLPDGGDVPVIIITVHDDYDFRILALRSGATDFLLSPVDHVEFLTRAKNLLKLRRQQVVLRRWARALERRLQSSEQAKVQMLRDNHERLIQVIDTVPAMISASDAEGRLIFTNVCLARFAGSDPATLAGRELPALFGEVYAERSRKLDATVMATGEVTPEFEEELTDQNGRQRFFITTKSPLRDPDGSVSGVLTTSLDITDRKRAEERLHYLAHYDTLINLPNRTLLTERLDAELARIETEGGMLALHFIDLDRFKAVNDAFGHHVGDQFLKVVATRLGASVRASDIVARLGGDEFAIVQPNITTDEDAIALARRVIDAMRQPFLFERHELKATASVGITICPRDATTADDLLRNADLAMYRAKSGGRDSYCCFVDEMRRRATGMMALESELYNALQKQEFDLYYQPQFEVGTKRIVGVESLLRWNRPGHGVVLPGEFLSLAEESGLIIPINEWVLRESCLQARTWTDAGGGPLRVAVNLSAEQFRKQNVRNLILSVLNETGLDPSNLELELTERVVMANVETMARELRQLQELGVRFAIDDFGTGYSSLTYLKMFPVHRLKIDQSFVGPLTTSRADAAIVRAIINLAHSLGAQALAEGVETEEQLRYLAAEDCDEVQGYYLSMPLPANEVAALRRAAERAMPGARGDQAFGRVETVSVASRSMTNERD